MGRGVTLWPRVGLTESRVRGLPALAILLVALLTGCGGGGYSKSDFIAQANAICTNTLRQTRAVAPPASTAQPGAMAAYLGRLVPLVQSEADQLRALKRPPGTTRDRLMLSQYFAALGQVVTAYRAFEAAARRWRQRHDRERRGHAPGEPRGCSRHCLRHAIVRNPGATVA